ncbi:hypothetical protein BSAF29S_02294 [Bacillus safensis subsp. safensis]
MRGSAYSIFIYAAYAWKQIEGQRSQFKRLGVRADWDNPYVTLKPEYVALQILSLVKWRREAISIKD